MRSALFKGIKKKNFLRVTESGQLSVSLLYGDGMSQRAGYEFKIQPSATDQQTRRFKDRTPLVYLDDLVTLAKSETRQPLTVTIRFAGSK